VCAKDYLSAAAMFISRMLHQDLVETMAAVISRGAIAPRSTQLSKPTLIGLICMGVVLVLLILVATAMFLYRRRRASQGIGRFESNYLRSEARSAPPRDIWDSSSKKLGLEGGFAQPRDMWAPSSKELELEAAIRLPPRSCVTRPVEIQGRVFSISCEDEPSSSQRGRLH
jgi:hypothetical protein